MISVSEIVPHRYPTSIKAVYDEASKTCKTLLSAGKGDRFRLLDPWTMVFVHFLEDQFYDVKQITFEVEGFKRRGIDSK